MLEILNEILKVVGSCDTCKHGNEALKKVDEGESWCYMFRERPVNCRYHDSVDNPLEKLINLHIKETP